MHISAKCGIGIAYRLSICLSVRDAGRSTPHKLESLEANCTDNYANTFALRSSKAIRLLSVMGTSVFFERLEVGWGKWRSGLWSTRAALSLKRLKIEEKLLWMAYRKSQALFRTLPSPTPYGLLFPTIGG